jgi:hypothetical protein
MAFARAAGGSMSDTLSSALVKAEQQPHLRPRRRPVPAGTARCRGMTSLMIRDEPLLSHLSSIAAAHALTLGAPKSVPSHHMRCRTTAILRASATRAFFQPTRLASFRPQALRGFDPRERVSTALAAS